MPFGLSEFSLEYKEACFYAWYNNGRPTGSNNKWLPPAPDGSRPSMATVKNWMRGGEGWQDWHQHADDLDAQVSLKLDKEAINKRARTLKKLAEDGEKLKNAGLEFLRREDPFKDNPSAAVRAVVAGSEMEFKYSGMAESLINIARMDDKQLQKEAMRLLGKNENNDDIIEVMEIPSDDGDSNPEDDND